MRKKPISSIENDLPECSKALRRFRLSQGLSVRRFAKELDDMSASTYQHYEDGYKKDRFPDAFLAKVERYLTRKGLDPNLLLTFGAKINYPAGEHAAAVSLPAQSRLRTTMPLKEVDIRLIDGDGEIPDNTPTLTEWRLPTDLVNSVTNAEPERMRIVTVLGDAMSPNFRTGQKLMVDMSDRRPTPSGVFLVWDGLADDIRNVAYIPHSDPPRVRIFPDNIGKYHEYERELPDAHIRGRVLGLWTWV